MLKYPRTFLLLAMTGMGAAAATGTQPPHEAQALACPEGYDCTLEEEYNATSGFIELLEPEESYPGSVQEEEWGWGAEGPPEDLGMPFPSAVKEPSLAFLEWGRGRAVDDPTRSLADGCARTPARARGRLARAIREKDENGLLSIYSWQGKGDGNVSGILAQLQSLPTLGHWEGTRVGMWTGVSDVREKVPTYWRWSDGVSHHHFSMRVHNECWMVEFSEAPPEAVEITPDEYGDPGSAGIVGEGASHPALEDKPNPTTDILVF